MQLLHCLWFFTALFDIDLTASRIAGLSNSVADVPSRNHIWHLFTSHPEAS